MGKIRLMEMGFSHQIRLAALIRGRKRKISLRVRGEVGHKGGVTQEGINPIFGYYIKFRKFTSNLSRNHKKLRFGHFLKSTATISVLNSDAFHSFEHAFI